MTLTAHELARALDLPPPTDEQAAVIEAPLSPALVVAGAGSGKTETMAARVLYLVATGRARPDQVLGLTFTRKAAAQLALRLRTRLRTLAAIDLIPGGGIAEGEPEVSTYHAFGGRIITDFGPLAGVEPVGSVLTPTAAWLLARRVVMRWDGDLQTDLGPDQVTERLLAVTGALSDHLVRPDQLSDALDDILRSLRAAPPSPRQRGDLHSALARHVKTLQDRRWIVPLVRAFDDAKRERQVVDFADQMRLAADLVLAHPTIGDALRKRHPVVLLDEYQDTGHAQRVILRTVFGAGDPDTGRRGRPSGRGEGPGNRAPAGHSVTAVGDPVQSIYSWRGASASNLPAFVTDFPGADGHPSETRTLLTSFRNPPAVLHLANTVSAPIRDGRQGSARVGELRPHAKAPDGMVRYGLFATVADEDAWVAQTIAEQWQATRKSPWRQDPPSTAVLVRRRADMASVAGALRGQGLPVEVVGLGGLLDEPEVADLVATLRVLVDPAAGAALIRLLSGARWQIGGADLAALARRSRELTESFRVDRGSARSATESDRAGIESGQAGIESGRTGAEPGRAAAESSRTGPASFRSDATAPDHDEILRGVLDQATGGEDVDTASLVDALADLGPPSAYSEAGYRRLGRFAAELDQLRSHLAEPLPDLIAEIERRTCLDIEVLVHSPAGRAHLDAIAEVGSEVAAGGAGPAELLDYLDAAAEREDGLAPGEVPAASGLVQVLTVHAAKGLEWEIVAVPHLTDGVFPHGRGGTWLGDTTQLPPMLRGDQDDLPVLSLPQDADQRRLADALEAHVDEFRQLRLIEERRLLYVALTRAERSLLFSGHHWGATTAKPSGPSEFLIELADTAAEFAAPDQWAPPPDASSGSPLPPRTAQWPRDPLGDRRAAVRAGADRVLAAMRAVDLDRSSKDDPRSRVSTPDIDPRGWRTDVAALLTERAAADRRPLRVELPGVVSVSTLVDLADDPVALARRLRRPVPVEPRRDSRRGSAFHRWLESFFGGEALLGLDELPGAEDHVLAHDPELDELRAAFLASPWASRVPVEIEVPFATQIAGLAVRGRIDAVFADPDGGLTVIDWKTGKPPPPHRRAVAQLQLACYRLAIAELRDVPVPLVRAAFHYVRSQETVTVNQLPDAEGLAALIARATQDTDSPGSARRDVGAGRLATGRHGTNQPP